jgi:hypothetical protein
MKREHTNAPFLKRWGGRAMILAVLAWGTAAHAQQGSQGNTIVSNNLQATLFGAHTFITGGTGAQPGIIKTERTAPVGIVSFGPVATYSGATNVSHIDGYVGKYGTAAFTFPTGNGTKVRSVGISAPASGFFKAAYWSTNPNTASLPAGGPFLVANLGTGVTGVSNVEYWDIDGPSAVNVTLSWDAASALGTLTTNNIANLIVVGYNATTSKWENLGRAGGTTGTLAATGTITANAVTPDTYAAFTFGAAAAASIPDLRPLYVMSDVGFIKPSALTKNATLRIYNVGEASSISTGPITVYIYPPNNQFTVALGTSPGWSLSYDAIDNYYTLTSTTTSVSFGSANFKPVNLVITAASSVSKGKYAVNFEIADGSGDETNSLNNTVPIEVTVSGT